MLRIKERLRYTPQLAARGDVRSIVFVRAKTFHTTNQTSDAFQILTVLNATLYTLKPARLGA
jgi:hypothetical protein